MTEVEPRILDFWEAFDRIEPFGESWEQAATICAVVQNGQVMQSASMGVSLEPKTYLDYMPPRFVRPKVAKPRNGIGLKSHRAKMEAQIK